MIFGKWDERSGTRADTRPPLTAASVAGSDKKPVPVADPAT